MAQTPDKSFQTKTRLLEPNMQPTEEPTLDDPSLWDADFQQNVGQALANANRKECPSASITSKATAMKRVTAKKTGNPARTKQAAQNQQLAQEPTPPLGHKQGPFQGQQTLQTRQTLPVRQPMQYQQAPPILNPNYFPEASQGQQYTETQNLAGHSQVPQRPAKYPVSAAFERNRRKEQQAPQHSAQHHESSEYQQGMQSQQQAIADQQKMANLDWLEFDLLPTQDRQETLGQQSTEYHVLAVPEGYPQQVQNQRSSIAQVPLGLQLPPQNQHCAQPLAQVPAGFQQPQQGQGPANPQLMAHQNLFQVQRLTRAHSQTVGLQQHVAMSPQLSTASAPAAPQQILYSWPPAAMGEAPLPLLLPPDPVALAEAAARASRRAQVPKMPLQARIAAQPNRPPMEIAWEHTFDLENEVNELASALTLITHAWSFEKQQGMMQYRAY